MRFGKSIRDKMIIIQIVLIVILLGAMAFFIYFTSCNVVESNNRQTYKQLLESADILLEDKLQSIREIARYVVANNTLQRELLGESSGNGQTYMSHDKFQRLNDVFAPYANTLSDIESIYIYNNDGSMFFIQQGVSVRVGVKRKNYRQFAEEEWYQKAIENKGKEIFYGYNVIEKNLDTFSCVKVLNRLGTREKIGLLVLNIKSKYLDGIFVRHQNSLENYGIVSLEEGRVYSVYHTDGTENLEELIQNEGAEQKDYVITSFENADTGWSLVHIISRNEMLSTMHSIRRIILYSIAFTVLLAIVFTSLVSVKITKPLTQLKNAIIRVKGGEREIPDEFGDDEIGLIGIEFKNLIQEKIKLNEELADYEIKQKEAELQLLQEQINPHFLYNTLDTIYWQAVINRQKEISEMTKALSNTFRISLSQGDKLITVQKEIEFIKSYLAIQNVRFDNRFHFEIDIEEELYSYKIIKLILQPFVENAIYHGLEPKMGMGQLKIQGYMDHSFLYFLIEDDGVGMKNDRCAMTGYGVRNVVERIRLHYGEMGKVSFKTELGKGTTVTIRIPDLHI